MKKVVVVAPTFNEEENIAAFLRAVAAEEKNLPAGFALAVLVSDSHSTDRTPEIIRGLRFRHKNVHYLDVKKRGLGLGLSEGIDYAVRKLGADIVVTMEADLSCDPKQIPQFINNLKAADLVVGSRYGPGGKILNWSWWRKLLSRAANLVLMALALCPRIHEYTNLYRAFKREVWENLRPRVGMHIGWLFVPAFVFEAIDKNITMTEQPIVYFDRFGGRSKMHTLSYTKDLLHYALRFRMKKWERVGKFAVVGGIGFVINYVVLVVGVAFGMRPSIAGPVGAEGAIVFGFAANNLWTFAENRISSWRKVPFKFLQYNIVAFGSVVIQFAVLRLGEYLFGLEHFKGPIINWPLVRFYTWYMFFFMWGVGIGMVWNFIMYSRVVWGRRESAPATAK